MLMGSLWAASLLVISLPRPASDSETAPAARVPPVAIDLNAAPSRELALLPRVGPVLARRIVADRERRGPFASNQALTRVPGVGEKTIELIDPYSVYRQPVTGRLNSEPASR
jgi:competence protein ComEA